MAQLPPPPRRIAFLAFPRMTLLDLIGVYDPLRRVATMGIDPSVTWRIVGTEPDTIADDSGLRIVPDSVYEDLTAFDLLVIPGGYGTRTLQADPRFLAYLRTWGTSGTSRPRPIASVCTGALLLGHAGYLHNLRATTHRSAYDELRPLCHEVITGTDQRVVDEGHVITAGGVSASIDLGLHLVARFWGAAARDRIATQMEYAARHDGTDSRPQGE